MTESSREAAERKVMDGSAWGEFCDLLKLAGETLTRPGTPEDLDTRMEGLRYLTRLTRAALETFVEHADPKAPVLMQVVHETAKMGADNPDNHYLNAAIDGASTYRLTGKRNTVHWLEFATQRGSYGQSGGMPPTGRLDGVDLNLDADGRFDVIVSADAPEARADGTTPDWLQMTAETGTLIVRQSLLDAEREELAEIHLVRLGDDGEPATDGPSPLDAESLVNGLLTAGIFVPGAAGIFAEWAEGFTDHVNELPRFDPELSTRMGGVPEIAYYHSYWRLGPDECLVIEATAPKIDHWNFQLDNHWMESLDYRNERIHVNQATAAVEDDGSLRVVVAHDDPGHPNWITTQGHAFGTMCWRWVRPEGGEPPQPSCRVVKLVELRTELA